MSGSLNHIVDEDGSFTMDTIENMGDAHEALEECFDLIAFLLEQQPRPEATLKHACRVVNAPMPKVLPIRGKRAEDR